VTSGSSITDLTNKLKAVEQENEAQKIQKDEILKEKQQVNVTTK
jgi:hypothetical protein